MSLKNNPILYQIYPRSFQDSNNDGIGDIPGIISRLDYLKDLGINILWLTPFFLSPLKDCGYDVMDYYTIAPEYGTMEDFALLIQEAHNRSIDVVIDLVINHTSDRHPWFEESRSSLDNPKRDWYIWRDPVNGGMPNNWKSVFDPSVWEYDEHTGQYYFHSFLKEQPDLNWKNPEVLQAVKDICAFWLDKGVDGFRLDAINYIGKHNAYKDEPENPDYNSSMAPYYQLKHIYMVDQPEIYPVVQELAQFVQEYADAYLIPEAYPSEREDKAIQTYKEYYNVGSKNNIVPFNFEFIMMPWNAQKYRTFIIDYLKALGPTYIPNFVLGNHDKRRLATRIGQEQAKVAAVLLLTLPGMPDIYYGEELGMEDVRPIPSDQIYDTKEFRSPGFGRDPIRTPMQWDNSQFSGFSTVKPWLPFEKAFKTRNVVAEEKDPLSFYNLYRRLLTLRNDTNGILTKGEFIMGNSGHEDVLVYTRALGNNKYRILANFSHEEREICLDGGEKILISTHSHKKSKAKIGEIRYLKPHEAVILVLPM